MMDEHEVYPNAPVVLVALELRHPPADALDPNEMRAVKARLKDYVPISRDAQVTNFQILPAPGEVPSASVESFTRFTDRRSSVAVSFRRSAILVEASVYPGWQRFSEIAAAAVDARMQIAPIDGVERIGLRYIDEIRVPSMDFGDIKWEEWVSPSLLGPIPQRPIELELAQWQGVAVYGSQPGHSVVLRYGPMVGFALDPASELKRAKPGDGGPYFLMDIDSFWTPEASIPELETEVVMATCAQLHTPVRTLFEGLIEDKLRDEVLRSHG